MTDEHLMRLWADAHHGFSADLDRGILKLDRYLKGPSRPDRSIGEAYVGQCTGAAPEASVSSAARAALAGVTACLATTGLLLTIALLATADLNPAHAYPTIAHTIVA